MQCNHKALLDTLQQFRCQQIKYKQFGWVGPGARPLGPGGRGQSAQGASDHPRHRLPSLFPGDASILAVVTDFPTVSLCASVALPNQQTMQKVKTLSIKSRMKHVAHFAADVAGQQPLKKNAFFVASYEASPRVTLKLIEAKVLSDSLHCLRIDKSAVKMIAAKVWGHFLCFRGVYEKGLTSCTNLGSSQELALLPIIYEAH